MASKGQDPKVPQVQDEVIQTSARHDQPQQLSHDSSTAAEDTPTTPGSLIRSSENASPDFVDRICEDFCDYEVEDEAFSNDRVSPASSSGSSSPPSTEHLEFADKEAEELRSLFRRPLPPVPVTDSLATTRRPPSALPAFYFPTRTPPPRKMPSSNVPKPGPAKLSPKAGLEEWLAEAKQCHYLPEAVMKQLCEMVKECLMEGEYYNISTVPDLSLTFLSRVQYPTRLYPSHDLRRHSWSIL
jgi:hypothetical protein